MSTTVNPLSYSDLDYGHTLRGIRQGLKVFGRYTLLRKLGQGWRNCRLISFGN